MDALVRHKKKTKQKKKTPSVFRVKGLARIHSPKTLLYGWKTFMYITIIVIS